MSKIFTIEGNIGAGKSTILEALKHYSKDIIILPEPVDLWMKFKPKNCEKCLFELFYQDNKKYGFAFQIYALQTRYKLLIDTIKNNPNKIIICERSIVTDNKIFAEIMRNDGIINEYEYDVYKNLHDILLETLSPLSGIIYLKTSTSICVDRIISRNRSGEESISIEYIKKLNKKHNDWLCNYDTDRLLILDGDLENSNSNTNKHMESIVNFINYV